MRTTMCEICGVIGCKGYNFKCAPEKFEIERNSEIPTNISVTITDAMIDTLSNDMELGAYCRKLLNNNR